MQEFNIKDLNIFKSLLDYKNNKHQLTDESLALAPIICITDVKILSNKCLEFHFSDGTVKHLWEQDAVSSAVSDASFVVMADYGFWILVDIVSGFFIMGTMGWGGEVYTPFYEDVEILQVVLNPLENPGSTAISVHYLEADVENGVLYYNIRGAENDDWEWLTVSAIIVGRWTGEM